MNTLNNQEQESLPRYVQELPLEDPRVFMDNNCYVCGLLNEYHDPHTAGTFSIWSPEYLKWHWVTLCCRACEIVYDQAQWDNDNNDVNHLAEAGPSSMEQ